MEHSLAVALAGVALAWAVKAAWRLATKAIHSRLAFTTPLERESN